MNFIKFIFVPLNDDIKEFIIILVTIILTMIGCSSRENNPINQDSQTDPRLWSHERLMQGAKLLKPAETNGIKILFLSGNPYQMGYQQGVLLKDDIMRIQDSLVWNLFYGATKELSPDGQSSYIEYARANALKTVLEECEGMVAGTGFEMEMDLCILHSSGMYILEDMLPRYFPFVMDIGGCSGFIAKDEATVDGTLLHARNLDYAAMDFIIETPMVYVRNPLGGLRHVTLGWAGMVGVLTGMNEKGIAGQINENSCPEEDYRDLTGVSPEQQLLEILTHAETLQQAETIIQQTEQATCQVMLISDGPSREGAVLEMWAQGYMARYIQESESGNVIFATNHFVHPEAQSSQGDRDITDLYDSSVSRYYRLSERLTGRSLPPHPDLSPDDPDYSYGRIDVEEAIKIMRDPVDLRPNRNRHRYPCTEMDGRWAIGNNHNVDSAIMKGESLEFWFAAGWDKECGNPLYNPFIGFSMSDLIETDNYTPGLVPNYDPPYLP